MVEYKSFRDKGVDFTFNHKRALDVCLKFYDLYKDKNSFYHSHKPPQFKYFPKSFEMNSIESALYHLNLVVLDVGDVSDQLYKRVSTFVDSYYNQNGTHFFDPKNILAFETSENLRRYMNEKWRNGIGFKRKFDSIMKNAHMLIGREKDLLNLDILTDNDVLKNWGKLQDFGGIKINASLLQRYMVDFGMWEFKNLEEMTVKVDTHKLRFPFQFGFYEIKLNKNLGNEVSWYREYFEKKFEYLYRDLAKEIAIINDSEPQEVLRGLDEIIWRLRSSYCSQNSMNLCEMKCEFESQCNGNPYITTQSSNKIKSRLKIKNKNFKQVDLFEDDDLDFTLVGNEEVYYDPNLIDRKTGNKLKPIPGNLYPFVDMRKDMIPIKILDKLEDVQNTFNF